MIAPDAKLGWRFGLLAAAAHLALVLLIWLDNAGWFILQLFHVPSLVLLDWLFPYPSELSPSNQTLFWCTFGTATWYIFGWFIGRIVMFYREHS